MPSELATGLARIVVLLPATTRADLRRLLAHDLAAPPAERQRATRLGPLCRLVEDAGGEVPTVEAYEEARRTRGEAPAASTLARHYGGWLRAVKAAAWLAAGGAGHPPVARVLEPQHPYSREEVLVSLERCRRAVGRWPGPAEYEEWVRLRRGLQRRFGDGRARTPGHSVVVRLFGGLNEARKVHEC